MNHLATFFKTIWNTPVTNTMIRITMVIVMLSLFWVGVGMFFSSIVSLLLIVGIYVLMYFNHLRTLSKYSEIIHKVKHNGTEVKWDIDATTANPNTIVITDGSEYLYHLIEVIKSHKSK